jgi:hypothetical protein
MNEQRVTLADFIAEEKLLQVFGMKKATLTRLRQEKQLPFIPLGLSLRVYSIPSLATWLLENERVLNRAGTPRSTDAEATS